MNILHKIPRRIVTVIKDGQSTIISEDKTTNISEHLPKLVISDIRITDTMPVNLENEVHLENTLFPNTPSHGTYFRYVPKPPDMHLNGGKLVLNSEPKKQIN